MPQPHPDQNAVPPEGFEPPAAPPYQGIQKSKDAAPIVAAGLGGAGLIGFASKVFQEEEATEES
ncbi:hypothetical protein [Arthrobacter humicola]|uniref:hypothetical protein n=1 Tax=Arthrobacter humicola TaxID=409291 RepID=UPI001FAC0849|nr:hypothetical protein [Arthrobacter humicola]MCI9869142.1 hypothetical protein [Arthrobacter humicola]